MASALIKPAVAPLTYPPAKTPANLKAQTE